MDYTEDFLVHLHALYGFEYFMLLVYTCIVLQMLGTNGT